MATHDTIRRAELLRCARERCQFLGALYLRDMLKRFRARGISDLTNDELRSLLVYDDCTNVW